MARILICYRRADAEGDAANISGYLRGGWLRRRSVVRDLDTVKPGNDFTVWMERELSCCNEVLFVVGPRWLTLLKQRMEVEREGGDRDHLGYELKRTLELCARDPRRRAIPVLVQGATMPSRAALEDIDPNLGQFALLNAFHVRPESRERDLAALADTIPASKRSSAVLASVVLATMGTLVAYALRPEVNPVPPSHEQAGASPETGVDASGGERSPTHGDAEDARTAEDEPEGVTASQPTTVDMHKQASRSQRAKAGRSSRDLLVKTAPVDPEDVPSPEVLRPVARAEDDSAASPTRVASRCARNIVRKGSSWWLVCESCTDASAPMRLLGAHTMEEATAKANERVPGTHWRCP